LDVIGLGRAARRIGDVRGPRRVVGEEEQSFAGLVQPAHGGEKRKRRAGETAEDGESALVIGGRGDEPARLVQHDVNGLLGGDRRSVDFEARALPVHAVLGFAHDVAVDAHGPGLDELPGLAAGAETQFGQRAGQPHALALAGQVAPWTVSAGFHGFKRADVFRVGRPDRGPWDL
jgi:hypothetical protein